MLTEMLSFPSPSLNNGVKFRPHLTSYNMHKNILYILELTVGFEGNLKVNSDCKWNEYESIILSQSSSYNAVDCGCFNERFRCPG